MRQLRALFLISLVLAAVSGCYLESSPVYRSGGIGAGATASGFRQRGIASFYGQAFHGNPTANGETFDMYGLTCAHRSLPFETVLIVRNLDNGREVTVRVNDRGPFVGGRIIDLSYGAAVELDMIQSGTAEVIITAVE